MVSFANKALQIPFKSLLQNVIAVIKVGQHSTQRELNCIILITDCRNCINNVQVNSPACTVAQHVKWDYSDYFTYNDLILSQQSSPGMVRLYLLKLIALLMISYSSLGDCVPIRDSDWAWKDFPCGGFINWTSRFMFWLFRCLRKSSLVTNAVQCSWEWDTELRQDVKHDDTLTAWGQAPLGKQAFKHAYVSTYTHAQEKTRLGQNLIDGWTVYEILEGFWIERRLVTIRHGHSQHF